jgi:glutamate 5-kinase
MKDRVGLGQSRRWVVKVGSALVTDNGRGLDESALAGWAAQIAALHGQGRQVCLVSSGAVAAGMQRLGWTRRPQALHELQAAAAVGQMRLIQAYETEFARHGLHAAQILLSYADLTDRQRHLNARSTLKTLLALDTIPIINENDTVSTDELRFGDNDSLASLVTNLVEAELMVILTDQEGLYERDPRNDPEARLIQEGRAGDAELLAMATPTPGALGRGGMFTKLTAAARAARSGAATVIASGRHPEVLLRVARGEAVGTLLHPASEPLAARKQWINGHLQVRGELVLDTGAVRVLREAGRSLLPVGVTAVTGHFRRGDVVLCRGPDGVEVARGLVNYSAEECRHIQGQPSSRIAELLGYLDEPELIHRDNMVVS